MKYSKSTRTKFALLGSRIVKLLKSKGSLYLIIISAIILFAPFAHIPYLNSEAKGLFGFRLMVSFLFAIALPLVLISSGLIIRFLGSYTPNHIKSFSNFLSSLVTASGVFFLVWSVSNVGDYPAYIYYFTVLALSVLFTYLSIKIQKFMLKQERILKNVIEKFRNIITNFVNFTMDVDDTHGNKIDYVKKRRKFYEDNGLY